MATLSQNVTRAIQDFDDIKDAIEDKGVEVPESTPTSQYAQKIREIEQGITPSGTIDINENGNNIDVTQYATANVNVPQPSGEKYITANGLYDVTQYAEARVNLPEPGGTISITENGTGIDVAQYAAADVNVISTNNDLALATSGHIRNAVVDFSGIETTYIRDGAFEDCQSLTSVQFTGGSFLSKIGREAFANTWVTSLDFSGYRIMNVWSSAFHTRHLTTIYFGQVDEFSENAFFGCTALTDIYYTGTQAEWEAITGLSGAGIPAGATIHYEYTPSE